MDETEQGIVQGALFSVSSLASAIGPLSFRIFYYAFKGTRYPGLMFLFGTFLFSVAGLIAYWLPESQTNSNIMEQHSACGTAADEHSLASTIKASFDGAEMNPDLRESLLGEEVNNKQELLLL